MWQNERGNEEWATKRQKVECLQMEHLKNKPEKVEEKEPWDLPPEEWNVTESGDRGGDSGELCEWHIALWEKTQINDAENCGSVGRRDWFCCNAPVVEQSDGARCSAFRKLIDGEVGGREVENVVLCS